MNILFLLGLSLAVLVAAEAGAATQHFGYIPVDPAENAQVFYWLVESSNAPSTDPVVLWMSGGPGCSGGLAMFDENGPFSVSKDGSTLIPNAFSWTKNATVIWIDQPAGTGFSYATSDYVHDEAGVAEEMKAFIIGFFKKYPQYLKQDFFLFGESYGGHYVPTVASMIAEEKKKDPSFPVTLKGVAIGNGIVDQYHQSFAQGTFALANNLINKTTYQTTVANAKQCQALIQSQKWDEASDVCNQNMMVILEAAPNTNPMKITDHCAIQDCFNYDNIATYLNQPSVKSSLGVPANVYWSACNYNDTFYFTPQDSVSSFAPSLHNAMNLIPNLRVLIYHGDLDLVCPWNGGLDWMTAFPWKGQKQFNAKKLKTWNVDGKALGEAKTYETLTFLKVTGGGHMTPHDVPEAALQLFNQFIYNVPFVN